MANQHSNYALPTQDKNMYQFVPYQPPSAPAEYVSSKKIEKEEDDQVEELVETNKDIIEKIRRIIVMAKRYGI